LFYEKNVVIDLIDKMLLLNKDFWNNKYVTSKTGLNVGDINSYLKSKSLIGDRIKHLPYDKSASMYVSKFICDTKTNWGIVKK
jgi:hypothetical protein